MLKNISYRNKNKYLLIFIFSGLFLIYFFAIKKTITCAGECSYIENRLNSAPGISEKTAALLTKLKEFDKLMMIREDSSFTVQQELLGVVTKYCQTNQTILRDFPKSRIQKKNEFVIETNTFVLEGSFIKLLELVYLLEQKERIGKIASIDFKSAKDLRTKGMALSASIYLQKIKKSSHE